MSHDRNLNQLPDQSDDLELNNIDDAQLDENLDEILLDDTETDGTGFHDQPSFSVNTGGIRDRLRDLNEASPKLTGGDIDANWEQANAVGDESVGGTVSTPDMDVVDELGAAVGLEMDDQAFLRTSELLEDRDSRRWELSPESSEDYSDRRD